MSVANGSRERVEQRLTALEETYSGFPVNQTTLAVSRNAYERVGQRCRDGTVDAYVRVFNDRGDVLLVERDGGWAVPRYEPRTDERVVEATERALSERTAVDCAVTDLERVTILGVRDEDDSDRRPMYRLVAVFTAEACRESPTEGGPRGRASDEQHAATAGDNRVRWETDPSRHRGSLTLTGRRGRPRSGCDQVRAGLAHRNT